MSQIRALAASIWVGWHREFSWTNPLLGLSLKTIAPVASVLTASTVYWLGATQARLFTPIRLAHILVGAALYAHVAAYSWVPTLAIAEGKWSNVFTQVYVSPASSPPYLGGRCLAAFATSAVTSIGSLVVAYGISSLIFSTAIPFIVTPLSVALLVLAMVVNIFASMGLGFLLSAYAIFATKFEWALPTYVSGLLMVFSDALFPVSILPHPMSDIGNALPFTAFIRASREALVYGSLQSYFYNLGVSLLGGVILLSASLFLYTRAEYRARRNGVLDRKVV